jgi:hypothetical protein
MTQEKKIILKYTVEILVEGYGDKPYFKEIAERSIKDLFLDITSAHVTKGSATVKIKKTTILQCEDMGEP